MTMRLAGILATTWFAVLPAQQQPPRDATISWPTGTSSIAGVVVTDNTGRAPLPRVVVSLTSSGLPRGRSTITDDTGRFSFANLPAGQYTLTAAKPAYLTTAYGATRAGRPGTAISVSAGQTAAITIALARGAVIAGALRYRNGEAAASMSVGLIRADVPASTLPPGVSRTPPVTVTNDRGEYRFHSLAPGRYLVVVLRPGGGADVGMGTASDVEIDRALAELQQQRALNRVAAPASRPEPGLPRQQTAGYAPWFFPGTALSDQATPLVVGAGQVRADVDFVAEMVRTQTIDGTISSPLGALPQVILVITPENEVLPLTVGATPTLAVRPDAKGAFKYTGVPPGTYEIVARTPIAGTPVGGGGGGGTTTFSPIQPTPTGPGAVDALWAIANVTVTDTDITGVSLVLQPGLRMAGQVRFEESPLPRPNLSTMSVRLSSTRGRGTANMNGTNMGDVNPPPAQVQRDGSFELSGILPNSYRFTTSVTNAGGWWLRSAIVNGVDVLDVPLDITTGGSLPSAVLTFSDKHTELAGSLQTADGQPAPGFFIVVIPANRDLWKPRARRMQIARPATDGTYMIRDLPPGDYLLAALTDVDPADLDDPSFLERASIASIKLSLGDGERKRQDIRLAR